MAAAANRQWQRLAAGEIDRADHISHPGTASDDRRIAIMGAVPDAALAVVILLARPDGGAAQADDVLGHGGFPDAGRTGLDHGHEFLLVASEIQERR